jgi:hypothetical protein
MEFPLLRLGLLGFDAQHTAQVVNHVQRAATSASRWEVVPFEDADIWLLNSAHVSMGSNHALHIQNPDTPHSPLTIYPQQTSRPVAFTLPLPAAIDAVLSIDLDDDLACAHGLNQFTKALGSLCAHFALGEQVASRQHGLHQDVYHLHFDGRMVAMVDLARWQVALAPDVKVIELSLASWRHRPGEAKHFPADFEVLSLERLMWVYASRSATGQLPAHFQTQLIYLRRLSVLPPSWLHNDHLVLIGHLSQQACTMASLVQVSRLPLKRLTACLSALYYSGTITTDARQVLRGDKRVNSNYAQLEEDSLEHSLASLHSSQHSIQSVFEKHSSVSAPL